tara:strand:- start:80 stop:493 length:414 start_codon:yes stop_codon:yes gene_type:complete
MPAYRFRAEKYVSRGFKDLAISFAANPSTDDFGAVKNENAIKQSVRNLLLTMFGERPFQEQIGSRVRALLFEPFDPFSVDEMKTEIRNTLRRLEPRIEVTNVSIRDDSDNNAVLIALDYNIVGETLTKTIDFLLERT